MKRLYSVQAVLLCIDLLMSNDTNEFEIKLKAEGRRSRKARCFSTVVMATRSLSQIQTHGGKSSKTTDSRVCVLLIEKRFVIHGYRGLLKQGARWLFYLG